MKKILSVIISAFMILSAAGCGSSQQEAVTTTGDSSVTTQASETETTVSEESITETTVSDESITETTVSQESITETTVSDESITETTVSDESITETTVSQESITETTVSQESITETTVSQESITETTGSGESITEAEPMRDITTMELVKEMGYGINLGNTFEACGDWINSESADNYIKAWGSPIITKKIIETYANAGFGVLRIPVAWSNMMEKDGTYTISPEYMARVKEAVDWTLESGMYAIINIHWDSGWLNSLPDDVEGTIDRFTIMWTQIAKAFEDYPDKLMFECQNEELGWESIWNPWSGKDDEKKESFAIANRVNQVFVDTIRSGGGNNPLRHLLISGYNTDVERTCDPLFKMPEDPAGRMAISVHYYTPSTLCILDKDASWGKARTEWGNKKDIAELDKYMNMLKETFIDKGIPVIVGEYGCFGNNKEREVKENWTLTVSKAMYKIGACPVLWDTPGDECDRANAVFRDPEFIEELIKPWKNSN